MTYGPISEAEIALLLQGLSRLRHAKPSKDGSITIGPADSQYVTTHEIVEAVIKALGKVMPDAQYDVFGPVFERKALRCCTGYLKSMIFSLTMKVIPEYDQRVAKAKEPALKTKYMTYLVEAKARAEVASKLYNKMERCL